MVMNENVYDRVNDYGSVKITLASPNDIRSWSFGEVKKRYRSLIRDDLPAFGKQCLMARRLVEEGVVQQSSQERLVHRAGGGHLAVSIEAAPAARGEGDRVVDHLLLLGVDKAVAEVPGRDIHVHVDVHPHRRQQHDVHRRVRIEPEQVLPQQRLTTSDDRIGIVDDQIRWQEEHGSQHFVSNQHEPGSCQHRQGHRIRCP